MDNTLLSEAYNFSEPLLTEAPVTALLEHYQVRDVKSTKIILRKLPSMNQLVSNCKILLDNF